MGFRDGAFATVWEITESAEKSTRIRLSTSRKNKSTGEYETDFNGFARLVGSAHKMADELDDRIGDSSRCRIKIGNCDVTNRYDKEKEKEYTNFTIFSFEFVDESTDSKKKESAPAKKAAPKNKPAKKKSSSALSDNDDEEDTVDGIAEDDDDDLPF